MEPNLRILERAALAAGEVIRWYFDKPKQQAVQRKPDGSPVTRADIEAEKEVQALLRAHYPHIPFMGEESYKSLKGFDPKKPHFICDALDGTKSFIKGEDDVTVNIAYIVDGRPVLGVVYAPLHNKLYKADVIAQRAFLNGRRLRARQLPTFPRGIIGYGAAADHPDKVRDVFAMYAIPPKRVDKAGSSLRMCYIAEGLAQVYPQMFKAQAWDMAAGDAIVSAVGGLVCAIDGKSTIRYDRNDFSVPQMQVVRRPDMARDIRRVLP